MSDGHRELAEQLSRAAQTRSVTLRDVGLEPDSYGLLRTDTRFADVERLALHHNQLGDSGTAALAANPALTAVTHLELVGNALGHDGIRALTSSPLRTTVTRLDLSGNPVTPEGFDALAEASMPALRELVLRNVRCGGLGALLRAAALDRLTLLDLSENDIADHDREYADWGGPAVYTIPADEVCVELRLRLGYRLDL
ncbi:hypothetical protein AB0J72_17080 [Dactylosporangium sp. NPDC049742]|uniref:hypothetical protein n=1 Tax=Dactylosporangium sp. NPDC049742 TaxID=3154737 RepID=UPI003420BAEF